MTDLQKLLAYREESKRKRSLYPPKPKPDQVLRVLLWCFLIGAIYLAVASTRYRFNHPELSETELFLTLFEAFTWQ